MRAVASANDELRGVFTVDWNQPAPDGSGKPLIPNEVVHALIQHFDEHDLSNKSVPSDVLGRAYEFLIKKFVDDAGAKARVKKFSLAGSSKSSPRQKLMRFICRNGFEHHAAMNASRCAEILAEAFEQHLGWDVYRHES